MVVVIEEEGIKFGELEIGKIFKKTGSYYLKVCKTDRLSYGAVCLKSEIHYLGMIYKFDNNTKVVKVDALLTIKE